MSKKTQPKQNHQPDGFVADANVHTFHHNNDGIDSTNDSANVSGHFTEFTSTNTNPIGVDEIPTLEKYQHDPNSRGYY